MRYYRVATHGDPRIIVQTSDTAYDLTSVKGNLTSFLDLTRAANITDNDIDDVADQLVAKADEVDLSTFDSDVTSPVAPSEIWAAGVTYEISEEAREAESAMPDMYREVYHSERPEIFFKATPSRTVGPGETVGIREDSDWDVPEPELGIVLYRGDIAGYTIGNDMSSRSIEGENPLYLPQAKIYDRCCSIGPCVASATGLDDPHDLEMSMTISRDGERVFEGSTTTANMAQTCEDLVSYYTRHNAVPELAVLLTGTAIVPDESFTLQAEDHVSIDLEGIGTLENDVTVV
ncbi:fumarylacetoacetate hydrolase family protein [Haloarcula brevis]|uniref:fumarylacetoacetate hydrolase family protein n=1 Tax=Haloarcula brevis TaxID=3111453 RepID=UPI00300EAEE6